MYKRQQSGLRYSQCKELLKILENHNTFRLGTDKEQNLIVSTIDNNVKGKILEELTIYNVQQSLDAEKYEVFQLSYPPVSYTHLDVYKRQVQAKDMNWMKQNILSLQVIKTKIQLQLLWIVQ